jgi:glycosyltransferase involved in cell wall biosynthesis
MIESVQPFSTALIVATFNDPSGLENMFSSIDRQTVAPRRVYVADDGSDGKTFEVVRRWNSAMPIEHLWQEHDGFRKCKVLNLVIARATEDYFVFVDGDELLHPRFMEDHLSAAAPGTAVLGTRCHLSGPKGSKLSRPPSWPELLFLFCAGCVKRPPRYGTITFRNRLASLKRGFRLGCSSPKPCSHKFAIGGNMAAWRNEIIGVNGFDERFHGWGHEEVDLVERMTRNGLQTRHLRYRAICFHVNHPLRPANPKNDKLISDKRPTFCENGIRQLSPSP